MKVDFQPSRHLELEKINASKTGFFDSYFKQKNKDTSDFIDLNSSVINNISQKNFLNEL